MNSRHCFAIFFGDTLVRHEMLANGLVRACTAKIAKIHRIQLLNLKVSMVSSAMRLYHIIAPYDWGISQAATYPRMIHEEAGQKSKLV